MAVIRVALGHPTLSPLPALSLFPRGHLPPLPPSDHRANPTGPSRRGGHPMPGSQVLSPRRGPLSQEGWYSPRPWITM